jgi:hypothetical protein
VDLKTAALLVLCACAPTAVHRPDAPPPGALSTRRTEAALERHVVAADGIEIHATLWDASLVAAAAVEDGAPRGWREDWAQTYLQRTSFTVVAEVEDRWPELPAEELLAAEHWSFRLDRAAQRGLAPSEVRLLVADRFPTAAGRHHHRLVFAVHFDGPLHASLPKGGPSRIRLRVGLRLPEAGRRPMTGHALRSRGTALHWRVDPA